MNYYGLEWLHAMDATDHESSFHCGSPLQRDFQAVASVSIAVFTTQNLNISQTM
jgi:hypothetical protein